MLTDKVKKLATEMGNELNNILDYWINRTIDNTNGGFYGQITGNNQLVPEAHKGVILNTRILWTFSSAYRVTHNPNYKEIADRAKNYILKHFIDYEMDGVYWSLDYKGNPLETKKQIYAQSFAIYAFSEYYKIEKDETYGNVETESAVKWGVSPMNESYNWTNRSLSASR